MTPRRTLDHESFESDVLTTRPPTHLSTVPSLQCTLPNLPRHQFPLGNFISPLHLEMLDETLVAGYVLRLCRQGKSENDKPAVFLRIRTV